MLSAFGCANPGHVRFNRPGKTINLFDCRSRRNSAATVINSGVDVSTSRWDSRGELGRSEILGFMIKPQPLSLVYSSHLPIQISFQVARIISSPAPRAHYPIAAQGRSVEIIVGSID